MNHCPTACLASVRTRLNIQPLFALCAMEYPKFIVDVRIVFVLSRHDGICLGWITSMRKFAHSWVVDWYSVIATDPMCDRYARHCQQISLELFTWIRQSNGLVVIWIPRYFSIRRAMCGRLIWHPRGRLDVLLKSALCAGEYISVFADTSVFHCLSIVLRRTRQVH